MNLSQCLFGIWIVLADEQRPRPSDTAIGAMPLAE